MSFHIGSVTQHKLWYLPMHQCWVSSGKDLMLNRFRLVDRKGLALEEPVKIHEDEITDIVEIESPIKCIVTCSMDKQIRMFNLEHKRMIRVFPQHHKASMHKMIYFEHYGRYLLSAGGEWDIYVWMVDNVVDDPLYGKLGGHK